MTIRAFQISLQSYPLHPQIAICNLNKPFPAVEQAHAGQQTLPNPPARLLYGQSVYSTEAWTTATTSMSQPLSTCEENTCDT